jgi:hypothetical protein
MCARLGVGVCVRACTLSLMRESELDACVCKKKMQDLLTVFLRLICERMLLARTAFESCANAPTLCLHNTQHVPGDFHTVVSLTRCLTHLPLGLLQMIVLDEIRVTPAGHFLCAKLLQFRCLSRQDNLVVDLWSALLCAAHWPPCGPYVKP